MKTLRKMIAILRVKWLQIELDRCRKAARELQSMEREMLHLKLMNHEILPEEYRWHRARNGL